jgi:putative ABC transport system permease protein
MTSFLDTLALALGTLRGNPLRSLLTLTGIVIGVVTVVTMMSLTEGLRIKVSEDMTLLGAASFHVQKWPAPGINAGVDWGKYRKRKRLTRDEGETLYGCCPHVAQVSIESILWPATASTSERTTRNNLSVYGSTAEFYDTNGYVVAEGRAITDVDLEVSRPVAVIGADVADLLFPGGGALGREVRLGTRPFRVIGLLERRGSVLGMESKDALVVIPLTTFDQTFGQNRSVEFTVQATSADDLEKAQDEVVAQLRRVRGVPARAENDFEVFSNDSLSAMINDLARTVGAAGFAVCALALLVGGIGIMNIMLVSVTERTREIGLRKALGARRRRILSQFMVEAVALSLVGGLAGVAIGSALAVGAREIYQVPTSIPAWAVILSLASASFCGLLFGIYPAARASRLEPVEAMRAE